ncbi:MAG: SDR family oxidoreductase [Agrobacterium cavarae]|uniref:SDR family oxidoreductase n=1 Tax=Agrobacterium cavarae TaxID=2528239 RepID=UPI0031AF2300
MKILILGASGFIGSDILRRLHNDGHVVTGLARNTVTARRKFPLANWIDGDLARMKDADSWTELVADHEVIVNCAGALQDGLADNLSATQLDAMLALYETCILARGRLIVQISAQTSGTAANLPFLATKRGADEALAASGLPHVIFRPALVIGRNAHGGTALIRALAGLPRVVPLAHAESPVRVVSVNDVASAVSRAVSGHIAPGSDLHLAADETVTLKDLVALHRQWLGLPPAKFLSLSPAIAKPVSMMADLAGYLGWRSPLRSTAMAVMSEGVSTQAQTNTLSVATAAETLARHPSAVQDLWFARLYLLKPIVILCLSLFWLLSGLVPLANLEGAASHFLTFLPPSAATALTLATCALDIALGLAVLIKRFSRRAMQGMLLLTAFYLLGATVLEPSLWLDPLGPLVKVLPSIVLTLTALATLEER